MPSMWAHCRRAIGTGHAARPAWAAAWTPPPARTRAFATVPRDTVQANDAFDGEGGEDGEEEAGPGPGSMGIETAHAHAIGARVPLEGGLYIVGTPIGNLQVCVGGRGLASRDMAGLEWGGLA